MKPLACTNKVTFSALDLLSPCVRIPQKRPGPALFLVHPSLLTGVSCGISHTIENQDK